MTELAILVPVLGRPHRVVPLLDAVEASTPGARIVFLTDPDDESERAAIHQAFLTLARPPSIVVDAVDFAGTYAQKINHGVRITREPLIFLGADDLEPEKGWFERAQEMMAETLAKVIGVNDLIDRPRRPQHATHFLITRDYAELPTIDGETGPLHEGYFHWSCDDELIATARHRGVYAYCESAHVRHVDHPMTGGPDDDTYRRGRAHAREDLRRLRRRTRLWT